MITRFIFADVLCEPLWRSLLGRDYRGRLTLALYREAHQRWVRQGTALGMTSHENATPCPMFVSRGAWVASCVECAAGMSTLEGAEECRCFSCGAIYTAVVWPAGMRQIAGLLLRRKPIHRNWTPDEPIDLVMAHNLAHGDRID